MIKKQRFFLEKAIALSGQNAYVKTLQQVGGVLDMVDGVQENGQPKDLWYFLEQIITQYQAINTQLEPVVSMMKRNPIGVVVNNPETDYMIQNVNTIADILMCSASALQMNKYAEKHILVKYDSEIRSINAAGLLAADTHGRGAAALGELFKTLGRMSASLLGDLNGAGPYAAQLIGPGGMAALQAAGRETRAALYAQGIGTQTCEIPTGAPDHWDPATARVRSPSSSPATDDVDMDDDMLGGGGSLGIFRRW